MESEHAAVLCNGVAESHEQSIAQAQASSSVSDHVTLNIEVCQASTSTSEPGLLAEHVRQWLLPRSLTYEDQIINISAVEDPVLQGHIESIRVCDCETERLMPLGMRLLFWQVHLVVHVFQLSEEGAADDDEGTEGAGSIYREWMLPAREFHNMWDALLYEEDIKARLLRYATTALMFGERGVNSQLVSFNRTVLLHGPPGTGKTTLCKALAQKLAMRFRGRFPHAQLIEVNAHSLFSKWFSESGKLVSRLFAKILELVEEQDCLVCVLLDEVESLTRARSAAVSGSEPADAIRAVNALLTQLDALKAYPNVLVLTTSNITEAIDLAFVDRADIKAYIGPPGLKVSTGESGELDCMQARYEILASCLGELHRVGVLDPASPMPLPFSQLPAQSQMSQAMEEDTDAHSLGPSTALLAVAQTCEGFSGRMLRKLPFLAHASSSGGLHVARPSCEAFAHLLEDAARSEAQDRSRMGQPQKAVAGNGGR